MAGGWFAKRFPRRLDRVSDADLTRMAWNPSYRAPHPAELLDPAPFVPPGPPPMSPTERELLDAVLADPAADEPRLRYAEWCDRQGDERGEFIRLQIDGRSPERERELLDRHAARWVAVLEPWSARDVVFRRGFAEGMSLAGRAFISISDGLFRTTPLRDVRLVAVAPYLDELARTPNLAKLVRLDLSGNWIGPAGVRELAASPYLHHLEQLDLSRNGLGTEGVQALLTAPWRGNLRSISLADNGLTDNDVARIAADPQFSQLAQLDVTANPLGEDWHKKRGR